MSIVFWPLFRILSSWIERGPLSNELSSWTLFSSVTRKSFNGHPISESYNVFFNGPHSSISSFRWLVSILYWCAPRVPVSGNLNVDLVSWISRKHFSLWLLTWSYGRLWVQGAQAVGMGKEAHTVPAAAALYAKANEILGWVVRYILCSRLSVKTTQFWNFM